MTAATLLLNFSGKRNLPVIRQAEAAECALACIAMIASYHGFKTNLNSLRMRHSVSLKGSTLQGLITMAELMGMSSRPLRVGLESIKLLQTPCVLHWNMNHFVVLKSVARGRYVIHDPALGEQRYTRDEISAKFTGIALELQPNSDFVRREDRKSMRLTDMFGKVTGLRRVLAQTLLLSIIVQLFVLAAPFYMQLVVDEVLTKFDTDLLVVLALGFGILLLIKEAASALRGYVILYISNMLGYQMVSNLFRHLLRLPLQWYEKRHVGDILSRFSSTRPIRDLFTEGLVAAFIDGLMAVSTLILIFVYSTVLGTVVLGVSGLYLVLRLTLYQPLRQRIEEQIAATAHEQSVFIESVRGIQSIKIFGHEAERQSHWQNKYADVINSSVKVGKLKISFNAANGLLFGLENTVVIYLGATMVVDGLLTVGMLFAFMAYKREFVEKISMLVERLIEFRLLGLHLERIADIGLALPECGVQRGEPSIALASHQSDQCGEIIVDHVSFRYGEGESRVLNDVSLEIDPGEMISIVGTSGGGKSTLMKLLLGLFEPEAGVVKYAGFPLARFGHAEYRRRIGTVMQDDTLLAGSVADNIAFFDSNPDLQKVEHCAEAAMIHTDIAAMPMGYNSLVGDMGGTLSAGQRQRVLLARALYREPEILLLDEGTANLDSATEASIISMLENLEMTRICVAHREAMIMASDRIILLQGGTLHELDKKQMFATSGRRQVVSG
jgi:ATP-binding cassette subfamily B protein RaxB